MKIEFGKNTFSKSLIIIDPQNDFIKEEHEKIVDNIVNLVEKWDGFVCVTQDTHQNNANYWYSPEGKVYPPHCIKDTYGWNINSKIKNAIQQHTKVIFEKNVFGSTEMINFFKNHLKYNPWPHFYICGFITDVCVLANAILLRTYFPNVDITILEDLCYGSTLENHKKALDLCKGLSIEVKKDE